MAALSQGVLLAQFQQKKAQARSRRRASKLVVPPRTEHVVHPGARGLPASHEDKERGYVELHGGKKAYIANGGLGSAVAASTGTIVDLMAALEHTYPYAYLSAPPFRTVWEHLKSDPADRRDQP